MNPLIHYMPSSNVTRSTEQPDSPRMEVISGLRRLQNGSLTGLIGQIILWSSLIALLIIGSFLTQIPYTTSITYGANSYTISAGTVFFLYALLVLGVLITLVSFVFYQLGFRRLERAISDFEEISILSMVGIAGFGMFATGLVLWLGSLAPLSPSSSSDIYTSQMDPAIGVFVWFLLILGGFLSFFGALGIAGGNYKMGRALEERANEVGGVFSALPLFVVAGQLLCFIGSLKAEDKIAAGWTPPPPPSSPPPQVIYGPDMTHPNPYPPGTTIVVSGDQRGPDTLLAILVLLLVLTWILLPTFLFSLSSGYVEGTGNAPGSSASTNTLGPHLLYFTLFLGLIVTVVLVALIVVRRRKRKALGQQRPPPPAPPPKQEDPLDHLV